jgi:Na+/H+ antiporter NhaD/arsenite permease-like protein
VAQPLRTPAEDEAPPVDPVAIHRNYRRERVRRKLRDERRRETRRANRRFRVVMLGLLVACVVLAVSVWQEIERLFGL